MTGHVVSMSKSVIRIVCWIAVSVAVSLTGMQSGSLGNEDVYSSAIHSTAWIIAGNTSGTGVLVDREQKLIVTNYHVTGEAVKVRIYFPEFQNHRVVSDLEYYERNEGFAIDATVVATDKGRDIAILVADRIPDGIYAIEFGEQARPGQSVHSIGNPSASDALWIYTFGKVRQNYYRNAQYEFGMTQMQIVETDSPTNPGDSGGPIVNDEGELVGISQGLSTQARMYSYGVDITELTWFLNKYKRSIADGETESILATDEQENSNALQAVVHGSFNDLTLFSSNDG